MADQLSEEHRLGSLILATASSSTGNYLLIRTGRHRELPRREWRVSVRCAGLEHRATGESLLGALERAWQWLQGSRARLAVDEETTRR